jgi:hypothetical protein
MVGATVRTNYGTPITGQHSFCLAVSPPATRKSTILKTSSTPRCHGTRQQNPLDLWSAALRNARRNPANLEVAVDEERELVGHQVYLWAPTNDDGLEWQPAELNNNKDVEAVLPTGE